MRYFVTGGTGFVGGHLIKALLDRGDQVVALVRDPTRAGDLESWGAELAVGDLTDKESMREPMSGTDGLFHVAGWYKIGEGNKAAGYTINVDGTRHVLELMDELDIAKGVYTSTLAINSDTNGHQADENYIFQGKHLSTYDKTKAMAHHQIAHPRMQAGLPLVIVQPGAIYGPGDTSASGDYIRDFLKEDLPVLPKEAAYCWAHVEDIVQGHLLAMDKGEVGESYIIAGPCHTMVEFFEVASDITGKPMPSLLLPPWLLGLMSYPMSLLDKLLPLPPAYTGEGLRVIAGTTYLGDNSKAKEELAYQPRSLREGLEQSLPVYQAEIEED